MLRTCSIVVAAIVLAAAPAAAQKVEATAAFERGQQLKRDGKVAEACAAFELSMKLQPQYGTQYNLALCYLDLGRTASAWAELDELSNKDPNQPRRADAARRARALRPRLTSVAITLATRVPELTVTRDGIDVTILVGAPTPVDPGEHRFVARAPGHREWSAAIEIAGEGKTVDVTVPALEPAAEPAPRREPTPVATATPTQAPPEPRDDHPGRTRRIAGVAAFSVGVVGLAVGAWYGVRAVSRGNDARRECGGEVSQCTGDSLAAQKLIDDGRRSASISNYAVAFGGALAATGVVLYVTAPHGVAATPLAGPSTVGLAVSGRF